jgi:hypothetical protein
MAATHCDMGLVFEVINLLWRRKNTNLLLISQLKPGVGRGRQGTSHLSPIKRLVCTIDYLARSRNQETPDLGLSAVAKSWDGLGRRTLLRLTIAATDFPINLGYDSNGWGGSPDAQRRADADLQAMLEVTIQAGCHVECVDAEHLLCREL